MPTIKKAVKKATAKKAVKKVKKTLTRAQLLKNKLRRLELSLSETKGIKIDDEFKPRIHRGNLICK